MKLTKDEITKLPRKQLIVYNGLSDEEKLKFAEDFRNKTETRGRHAANCDCEKCKEKRKQIEEIISKETENEKQETEKTLQESKPTIEADSETGKETLQTANQNISANNLSEEQELQNVLDEFKTSQQKISSENKTEIKTEAQTEIKTEQQQQNNYRQNTIDITQFISGALFLIALDYIFPIFLKYVVGFFNKKYRNIKQSAVEKLALTQQEKTYLEPTAEMMVKYIFQDANPLIVGLVVMGGIYGGKFMLLSDSDFETITN